MRKLLVIPVLFLILGIAGCYSCQTWNHLRGNGERADFPPHKFMWQKSCKPLSQCIFPTATNYYPGDDDMIKLEKSMPAEVAANVEFDYTIKVTNTTDTLLDNVVVTEDVAKNFKLTNSDPKTNTTIGKLAFALGELGSHQTKVITIFGMATTTDCLKSCAEVTYIIPTCTSVHVVQPALKLVQTAPASVSLCQTIPVKFVVTNAGSGSVGNVIIEDTLPAGLKTSDGKNTITIDAGTLAVNQSKEFSVTLKADKTGKYENKAIASSSTNLKAEASTTTEVCQPVLVISKNGPDTLYIGRPANYEIKVINKGNAPATNAVLTDTIPAGVTEVKASNDGTVGGSNVIWNIGTLEAGAAKTVSVSYTPKTAGTISDTAKATASCAEEVSASSKTTVTGIAAVLLEVIDVDDPIEIGHTETYVITATNQGSAPDTNIKIICTLEDSEQYVSSSGATTGIAAGNTITFAPLPSLAPKAQATWRVTVKAVKAGDVRFTTVMTTDQLTRPVQETEATNLYQ